MEDYAYHENGGKLFILPSNLFLPIDYSAIVFYDAESNEEMNRVEISQNENGRDIEDRIELALHEIGKLLGYPDDWHKYEFVYTPARSISEDERRNITRSARTLLRVILPSGVKIEEESAKDTFLAAIKEADVERVKNLNLEMCNIPLVSSSHNTSYSQVEIEPGMWVITHSSTIDKKRKLEQISESLGLGWIVKVVNS